MHCSNQNPSRAPRAATKGVVKPARLHFARAARDLRDATCVSEASCPNFEPRAHARLTGLTTRGAATRAALQPRAKGSGQSKSDSEVARRQHLDL